MKKAIKIFAIVVGSVFAFIVVSCAAVLGYFWCTDDRNMPQNKEEIPFSAEDYVNKFNIFELKMNDSCGCRWSFSEPDFRIKGTQDWYGYYDDPEHIYAYSFSYMALYYKGEDGYPDLASDPVEKISLACWNQAEANDYGVEDSTVVDWLTDSEQIKLFLHMVSTDKTAKLSRYKERTKSAYIRVKYKNSPISEVVGELIETSDNEYFYIPFDRKCDWYYGIPIDVSAYGALSENSLWVDDEIVPGTY